MKKIYFWFTKPFLEISATNLDKNWARFGFYLQNCPLWLLFGFFPEET
jgi:hypothetical protein